MRWLLLENITLPPRHFCYGTCGLAARETSMQQRFYTSWARRMVYPPGIVSQSLVNHHLGGNVCRCSIPSEKTMSSSQDKGGNPYFMWILPRTPPSVSQLCHINMLQSGVSKGNNRITLCGQQRGKSLDRCPTYLDTAGFLRALP